MNVKWLKKFNECTFVWKCKLENWSNITKMLGWWLGVEWKIDDFNLIFVFSLSESFHKHPMEIDLTQACIGEVNTILRGDTHWPIIYGIGANTKTGEIFPGECIFYAVTLTIIIITFVFMLQLHFPTRDLIFI